MRPLKERNGGQPMCPACNHNFPFADVDNVVKHTCPAGLKAAARVYFARTVSDAVMCWSSEAATRPHLRLTVEVTFAGESSEALFFSDTLADEHAGELGLHLTLDYGRRWQTHVNSDDPGDVPDMRPTASALSTFASRLAARYSALTIEQKRAVNRKRN